MNGMALDFSAKGLENGLRLLAPATLLFAMFMLSVSALPLPHIGPIKPLWLLMLVYYWSIYRPAIMPPWLCFMMGLLFDFFSGLPLGGNAAIFTLVQMIVRDQRRFLMGQPYITIWAVFSLVATLTLFSQWSLYGLVSNGFAPVTPVAVSLIATIALFPLVTLLLIVVHRVLPEIQKKFP
jgi:rod shape-determining protein MreD